jgi:hypothetical protein
LDRAIRSDAASINAMLAIHNDTGADLAFPLLLATTDPEERDPSHALPMGRGFESRRIKAEFPMALGEVFAAATAVAHDAPLLTGDPTGSRVPVVHSVLRRASESHDAAEQPPK